MSGNPEFKQQNLAHLSELERKLEKLLNWAKAHTEIGLDLMGNHPVEEQTQIKRCFVRSLELGQELIVNIGHERNSVPVHGCRTSRRDSLLPLSGSSRFGDGPGARVAGDELQLGSSLPQNVTRMGSAVHQNQRHSPLTPSKSYSKKKVF